MFGCGPSQKTGWRVEFVSYLFLCILRFPIYDLLFMTSAVWGVGEKGVGQGHSLTHWTAVILPLSLCTAGASSHGKLRQTP